MSEIAELFKNAANDFDKQVLQMKLVFANRLRNIIISNIDKNFGSRVGDATAGFRGGASGALRNTVQVDVKNGEPYVSLNKAGNVPYWRIHEYGGVIRPKRRKWLTIPAIDEFRARRATEFNNLTFVEFRKNKAVLIADTDSINERIAYYLVKKVTIPARPYIAPARKELEEEMSKYNINIEVGE